MTMQDNNAEKIDLTKYVDYFFRTVLKLKKTAYPDHSDHDRDNGDQDSLLL